MLARLLAALALAAGGLVLVSAPPAAACSCARLSAEQYAERADFAFLGTATSARASDGEVVYRFAVDTVHTGRVSRTQDLVTPQTGSSCDQRLPLDRQLLVVGTVDGRGRLALPDCHDTGWYADDPFAGTLQAALGPGAEPRPGRSLVEVEASSGQDLVWSAVAVGVLGALGMVVVRLLARRSARG